jgi:hypothetical protein
LQTFVTIQVWIEDTFMRYTVEDGGRLNNFAVEPKMYAAEPPTNAQKRNYILLGIGAAILVATVMVVAVFVS